MRMHPHISVYFQPPLPENALGLDLGRMSPDYHKMMRGLDSIAPSFTPHITPMARNICSEEPFHVRYAFSL